MAKKKKKKNNLASALKAAATATEKAATKVSGGQGTRKANTRSSARRTSQTGDRNYLRESRLRRNNPLDRSNAIEEYRQLQAQRRQQNRKAQENNSARTSQQKKQTGKKTNNVKNLVKGTAKRYAGSQISGVKDNAQEVLDTFLDILPGGDAVQAGKNTLEAIYNNTVGKKNKNLRTDNLSKKADNKLNEVGNKLQKSGQKDIDRAKKGKSSGEQFLIDLGTGLGELGLDAALTRGRGTMAAMYNRAYGSAKQSALDEGANEEQAKIYGKAIGGLEAATEKMFSVAAPLRKLYGSGAGDELTEKVLSKIVSKTSSKAGKNAVYHGGKTFTAAITEGLEEMVSEGLDPVIANTIYANAIGNPHETSAKDIFYSGAVGGAMGGLLGGGGQVVEYNRGRKISDNATNIFGEGGVLELVKKGLDIDEDTGGSTRAAAYREMIESGNGLANGQVSEMYKEVYDQEIRDLQRYDVTNRAADEVIARDGLANVVRTDAETGEARLADNTQAVYNSRKSAVASFMMQSPELQLPEVSTERISSSVAAIQTGVAGIDDVNMFTVRNAEARAVYEQTTGEKLPETNKETKEYLYQRIAQNRVQSAEAESAWWKDTVRGLVQQDISATYEPAGQEAFSAATEAANPADAGQMEDLIVSFEHFYEAGRSGRDYAEISTIGNPAYEAVPVDIRRAAYEAGIQDRQSAIDTAIGTQMRIGQTAKKSRSMKAQTSHRGKLISELSTENRKQLPSSQQRLYRMLAKAFNIDIHVVDELPSGANGEYRDGVIYLSMSSDRALEYVFAHEITHHMQSYAPEQYEKFKGFVRKRWGEEGGIEEAISDKIVSYKTHGVTLSREEALDEILADSTYEMVQDEEFINELCRENRSIAQAILNAIKDVLSKIRAILVEGDRFAPKQNEALLSQLDILKEAEKLWTDGLVAAVENRAAVGAEAGRRTGRRVQPFDITRSEILRNMKTVTEMPPVVTLDGSGFTKKEGRPLSQAVMDYYGGNEFYVNNPTLGDVKVGKRGIKSSVQHRPIYGTKIEGFKALKEIISDGLVINASRNYAGRRNDRICIAAPIKIGDEIHYAGVVINRNVEEDMQNYYLHDVITIEKNSLSLKDTETQNETARMDETVSPYTILQQLNNINNLSENDVISDEGRFSLKEPVEETKDLIAQHNIGADNLRKAFALGGFPMPSIAITKADVGRTNFGEVSLIFDKGTIDPSDERNKVFGADAWTPTFPAIEYEMNEDRAAQIYDMANELGNVPFFNPTDFAPSNLEERMKNRGEVGLVEYYKDDYGMKQLYLADTGEATVDYVRITVREEISEQERKAGQWYLDNAGELYNSYAKMRNSGENPMKWRKERMGEIQDAYKRYLANEGLDSDAAASVVDGLKVYELTKPLLNAGKIKNGKDIVEREDNDIKATQAVIDEKVNQKDYEEWLNKLFSGIASDSSVWNGKDPYSPSGDRRSFKSTHMPVTLDNIVSAMLAQADGMRNADSMFVGTKTIRAVATEQFGSIEGIREASKKIQRIDTEEYNALKEELDGRLSAVMSEIVGANNKGDNQFVAMDNLGYAIEEACTSPTQENIKKTLEKYQWNVTDEQAEEINSIINEVVDMPVNMFEAKPLRPVGFDEVKAAVVPNNIEEDIRSGLTDRGVEVFEYESDNNADRINKVNAAAEEEGVRFSLKEDSNEVTTGELVRSLNLSNYSALGIRSLAKDEHYDLGDTLRESYDWDLENDISSYYTENPRTLGGTSARDARIDTLWDDDLEIAEKLDEAVESNYEGEKVLVGGDFYEWGYDDREVIISGAKVLAKYKEDAHVWQVSPPGTQYSFPDEDSINNYANEHETEFVDVPPVRDYEKRAKAVRTQSMSELQEQVRRLSADKRLTYGRILEKKSIKEQMNELVYTLMGYSEGTTKRTNHALVDVATDNAARIFKDIKTGDYAAASNTAYDAAREIVENLELVNDSAFHTYKELRDYLRNTKIEISKEERSNIPDFVQFRKAQMGRIRIVDNGGISVDAAYDELTERYPELFGSDITHPAEQLMRMAEVREGLEPYDVMLSGETTEQLIKQTAQDILDIAATGSPWKSFADRKKEAYDNMVKTMKARQKEAIRDVRIAERQRATRMVNAEKRKARTRREKEKARREHVEKYGSIYKNYKWLSDRLVKPTDDKHIPEGFRKSLAQLLMQMDFQTERSKALEKKYGKAQKTLKMEQLRREYEKIAREDGAGPFEYDGYIFELMDALCEKLEGKSIDQATNVELRSVDIILKAIAHNIRSYNKAFDGKVSEAISQLAEESIGSASRKVRKFGKYRDRTGLLGGADALLNESMVTPRDFFTQLGGGIEKAFLEIRRGFDKHVDNITATRDFFEGVFSPYSKKGKPGSEIEKWRDDTQVKEFKLESGQKISLNPAQVMSLYCLQKREQAIGHMLGSGIVASKIDTASRMGRALGVKLQASGPSITVSMTDVDNIISSLTPEQLGMADRLQGYLNNECAEWGNEASMKLYGYRKFTEENYFPIKSADAYLDSSLESRNQVEKIKNFGFTKGTVVNANNPIMIDDIFSVVADHINKMSQYSSFAVPITDFMRVYNYKRRDEGGLIQTSTKAALEEAYGKKAINYINNFMSDLQNNLQTRTEGLTRLVTKTMANYKKATIGGNLRVALQQPTAITRAFALISPRYFVNSNINPAKNLKDMKKHCQVARWKSWGHSQVDMARDIDDIMMNNEWSRIDAVTMQIYGSLDNLTWSMIWAAVRKETAEKYSNVKVDSQEFYRICNERASEIFDKTQVVDSVLHRSQMMRNTDVMSKLLTSFMAEPTRTYNMIRSDYAAAKELYENGEKGKAAAKAARATTVFVVNAAVCAAAAAVADALRGKDIDGDDEPEKWLENALSNFWDNVNPLNMIPFVKDVWGFRDGWGSQNMAFEGFEDLMGSVTDVFDKIAGDSDKTWGELSRGMAESIGLVTGVPVKNILREVESIFNIFGIKAFASEAKTEEENTIYDVPEDNLADKALALFGRKKSDTEKQQEAFEDRVADIKESVKGLTGNERQEAIWSIVTENYTKYIENMDFNTLREMRRALEAVGGDSETFNERVLSKAKSAMKKNIGKDGTAVLSYRHFLNYEYGVSDGKINQEIIMKSDVAKEFQIAAVMDDYDAMVDSISKLYDAGLSEAELDLLYANRAKAIDAGDYATGELAAPVEGRISSGFGYRNAPTSGASSDHKGIDIAAAAGSDVVAADGGKVTYAGYNNTRGYYVRISHGNGRTTLYQHLQGYYVQKGDVVNRGDTIALVGSTGVSTGPHLHFEVQENGTYVDPMIYFQ